MSSEVFANNDLTRELGKDSLVIGIVGLVPGIVSVPAFDYGAKRY